MSKHIGAKFDDFLEEEGILAEVEVLAAKRLLAMDIQKAMKERGFSKSQMAKRMRTSRAQLDRLLDPENASVTLATLAKAATVLGRKLHISLETAA